MKNLSRRQIIGIIIVTVLITAYLLIENKLADTMSEISTGLGLSYLF